MEYSKLVEAYEKIESTTKRLEITDYLSQFFKTTPKDIIEKVIYLSQGKIYPDFTGVEFGIAEKLVINAVSFTTGISEKEVNEKWIKHGDLGLVAFECIENKKQRSLFTQPLTIERVYGNFETIARSAGAGSQELKIKLLADLLHDSTPIEAKYIVRTVVGNLRLGIADMTILDALAVAFAQKENRDEIERAYNVCSDLGKVGKVLAENGIEGISKIKLQVGIPLRAMLAERLSTVEEIFEKMEGECAFEYKYDGLRIQAHLAKNEILLYSRRLENVTSQFPDIQKELQVAFKDKDAVLEGECVPVDINTGELLPFQEVSHRRGRKYGIETAVHDYPVTLFLFDCLYSNGEDLTLKDYLTRRKKLESIIKQTNQVKFSKMKIISEPKKAEEFFQEAIDNGLEGLIAKSTKSDSFYKAGARGWQWIKYKREYKSEMTDTVDLVVVGAFAGHGRRAGSYGALLMAAYNPIDDKFETVCKLGSGFDDEILAKLPDIFDKLKLKTKDHKVKTEMKADFWFVPQIVLEVLGAEITLSPIHTCAYGKLKANTGLAIRFPRFTGGWRDDKKPEDATTSEELIEMYNTQLKRLE